MTDYERGVEQASAKYKKVIREYVAENSKLREQGARLFDKTLELGTENTKLRELCTDMWRFTGAACKKYPRLFDPAAQGPQTVQLNALDSFEQRMRELGIEASE